MTVNGELFGAFIVPTGIGASIGGFAGDASPYAAKFAQKSKLIVNPNVVNAGGFSGIKDNMLYVEGYTLDEFFKGNIGLKESFANKIGVLFDRAIPKNVLNVHLNTINAVKAVYGVNVIGYDITEEDVGVEFFIEKGVSTGNVKNMSVVIKSAKKLIEKGADAIAIVCLFEESEDEEYSSGIGVDPVGGVEAIISHYVSRELKIPCAHAPAFKNIQIDSTIVDARVASEYITPTFLPCVLLGLNNAPDITVSKDGFTVDMLDYVVFPHNALGGVPVFESLKRGIKLFAVKENKSVLNVTNNALLGTNDIITVDSYSDVLEML